MKLKVLIVEDDDARMDTFEAVFARDDVTRASTAGFAHTWILVSQYDLVMLDHDLQDRQWIDGEYTERTGQDVARTICALPEHTRPFVIVHSWNPDGSRAIGEILREGGVQFMRRQFGADIGLYVDSVRRELRLRAEGRR